MINSIERRRAAPRFRPAAAAIALAAACGTTLAHEYYAEHFQVVHPWVDPAPAGTKQLVLSMDFVEITADDKLVAASTPIAESVELRPQTNPESETKRGDSRGIPLRAGQDAALGSGKAHLVLRNINTDLQRGHQYPLQLVFEKAGALEAELIIGDH